MTDPAKDIRRALMVARKPRASGGDALKKAQERFSRDRLTAYSNPILTSDNWAHGVSLPATDEQPRQLMVAEPPKYTPTSSLGDLAKTSTTADDAGKLIDQGLGLVGVKTPSNTGSTGIKGPVALDTSRSLPSSAYRGAPGPAQATGSGSPAKPVSDAAIPPQGQALLATIGGPGFESNGSYTQWFNQPDFTDFSWHPGTYGRITRGPNAGKQSNAAGRYQFLSSTWNDEASRLGLKDFSPASQDLAAWGLAQKNYRDATRGRDLSTDLQDPRNLPGITSALKATWTSLPGGIEQGGNFKHFVSSYDANLAAAIANTQNAQTTPSQGGVAVAGPAGTGVPSMGAPASPGRGFDPHSTTDPGGSGSQLPPGFHWTGKHDDRGGWSVEPDSAPQSPQALPSAAAGPQASLGPSNSGQQAPPPVPDQQPPVASPPPQSTPPQPDPTNIFNPSASAGMLGNRGGMIDRALGIARKSRDSGGSTSNPYITQTGSETISPLALTADSSFPAGGGPVSDQQLVELLSFGLGTPLDYTGNVTQTPAPQVATPTVTPPIDNNTVGNTYQISGTQGAPLKGATPSNTLNEVLGTNSPSMQDVFGFNYPNIPPPQPNIYQSPQLTGVTTASPTSSSGGTTTQWGGLNSGASPNLISPAPVNYPNSNLTYLPPLIGGGNTNNAPKGNVSPTFMAAPKATAARGGAIDKAMRVAQDAQSGNDPLGAQMANSQAPPVSAVNQYERGHWFHGTQQPWKSASTSPVYLTKHADEAVGFAENPIAAGHGLSSPGTPQFHKFKAKIGNVEDIDSPVTKELFGRGDIDGLISRIAKKRINSGSSTRYLEFNHPSVSGKRDELRARVSLYPHEDLQYVGSWTGRPR